MNSQQFQNRSGRARLVECLSITSLIALARFVGLPLNLFVRHYEQLDLEQE